MSPWSERRAADRALEAERDEALRAALAGLPAARRVLDLGCGRGGVLPALGLEGVGIDVDRDRLRQAPGPVVQADATRLPVDAASVDLVVACNVVSSIPGDGDREAMAREVRRVLRPGGAVLWYDQRWPNPANRATRAVTRRDLARLFPGARLDLRPITPIPALARRRLRVPVHTHLVGVLAQVSRA
jgi:SAM-dependent methyltransferase